MAVSRIDRALEQLTALDDAVKEAVVSVLTDAGAGLPESADAIAEQLGDQLREAGLNDDELAELCQHLSLGGDDDSEATPTSASSAPKKKAKCVCKKKCKGPCKAIKAKQAAEKAAEKAGKGKAEESKREEVPMFAGRSKAQSNLRDIIVEGYSLTHHGKFLLEEANIQLNYGNRYGLIGLNGCGKTTLLKAIAKREVPVPANLMIHLTEDEVPASEVTALAAVVAADRERAWLLEEEARLAHAEHADPNQLARVVERLHEIEAETADARAATILDGLGFTAAMQQMKTREFSGGWRMRITLAQALFLQPDVLLLDEPTNHLDLEACIWLEQYLKNWQKILLVVSHAQDFLNGVCTDTIHMKDGKLFYYGGSYDTFVKTREESERRQLKAYEREQEEIQHLKQFIARFGSGSRASQAQSRQKAMNKMVEGGLTAKPSRDRTLRFRFPDGGNLKGPIITFVDCGFNYPNGRPLYRDLDFGIDMETRVALVGPNGVGKSTLLKLIAGDLEPSSGVVRRSPHVRVGRFHQHFVEQLDMSKSALTYMMETFPGIPEETMRGQLGKFALKGSEQLCPMKLLSGGQKSRVVFAWIAQQQPDMLLLDEPTNHLDIETIDALSEAIVNFAGAVLVVSHDTRLIRTIAKSIWLVDNQTVTPFHGTIEDYRRKVLQAKGIEVEEDE